MSCVCVSRFVFSKSFPSLDIWGRYAHAGMLRIMRIRVENRNCGGTGSKLSDASEAHASKLIIPLIGASIFSDTVELQNSDVICCCNLATRRSHVRDEERFQMAASFHEASHVKKDGKMLTVMSINAKMSVRVDYGLCASTSIYTAQA